MQGGKQAVAVTLLMVAFSLWYVWRDAQPSRVPTRFADRVRVSVRAVATALASGAATSNQNPVVALLRLSDDDAYLNHIRQLLSDSELSEITQLDIVALSAAVKTEQNKAFQRLAYFLPQRLGHDAYMQWYFPQTTLTPSAPTSYTPSSAPLPSATLYSSAARPNYSTPSGQQQYVIPPPTSSPTPSPTRVEETNDSPANDSKNSPPLAFEVQPVLETRSLRGRQHTLHHSKAE